MDDRRGARVTGGSDHTSRPAAEAGPCLEVGLLGPLCVRSSGGPDFAVAKLDRSVGAVLVIMAANAGRPIAVKSLAKFVGRVQDPVTVQDSVSRLRRFLRESLITVGVDESTTKRFVREVVPDRSGPLDTGTYQLASVVDVDLERFMRHAQKEQSALETTPTVATALSSAALLREWRGDPLLTLAAYCNVATIMGRAMTMRDQLLASVVHILCAEGETDEASSLLEHFCKLNPLPDSYSEAVRPLIENGSAPLTTKRTARPTHATSEVDPLDDTDPDGDALQDVVVPVAKGADAAHITVPDGLEVHPDFRLVVVTGPSGVGKDTLVGVIEEQLDSQFDLDLLRKLTTRARRAREHEYTVSVEWDDYQRVRRSEGFLLEYQKLHTHYGFSLSQFREAAADGRPLLMVLGTQLHKIPILVKALEDRSVPVTTIFLSAEQRHLERRALQRNFSEKEVIERLASIRRDCREIELRSESISNFTVINNGDNYALEDAADRLLTIITEALS